jgi:hypothetical protein
VAPRSDANFATVLLVNIVRVVALASQIARKDIKAWHTSSTNDFIYSVSFMVPTRARTVPPAGWRFHNASFNDLKAGMQSGTIPDCLTAQTKSNMHRIGVRIVNCIWVVGPFCC